MMHWMKRALAAAVVALAVLVPLTTATEAHAGPKYVVAVNGYDPVSYFQKGGPKVGKTPIFYRYEGATYLFGSRANREIFKKNPERYAPQFDGYCAWAASKGVKAVADPLVWTVHKGKLYLNLNRAVQRKWLKDIDARIKMGRRRWRFINSV